MGIKKFIIQNGNKESALKKNSHSKKKDLYELDTDVEHEWVEIKDKKNKLAFKISKIS